MKQVNHLKPMEMNLRMIEDTLDEIQKEFDYIEEREKRMRDTNGNCLLT